jgi:hypothetical protein
LQRESGCVASIANRFPAVGNLRQRSAASGPVAVTASVMVADPMVRNDVAAVLY